MTGAPTIGTGLLQLDPGTLSPLIKRPEAAGLLRRNRDSRDERAPAIALTDEGPANRHCELNHERLVGQRLVPLTVLP